VRLATVMHVGFVTAQWSLVRVPLITTNRATPGNHPYLGPLIRVVIVRFRATLTVFVRLRQKQKVALLLKLIGRSAFISCPLIRWQCQKTLHRDATNTHIDMTWRAGGQFVSASLLYCSRPLLAIAR